MTIVIESTDAERVRRTACHPGLDPGASLFGFAPFLVKSVGWGILTYLIATQFATSRFWLVVLSVFLFSVPVALCGIYASTIRQVRRLTMFAHRGWLFRLVSGRPMKVLLWICWALITSFFMLVQFHTYTGLEWCVFFLVIPVFWVVFAILRKIIGHEIRAYLVPCISLLWARRVCPVVMLLISMLFANYFGDIKAYSSLADAIGVSKGIVADMTGSAVVQEVSQYLAFYDGVKAYAIGRLGDASALWQLAVFGIGSLVVFYNACAILSCFLIPGMEYRRVFGPLSDADQPPSIGPSHIAILFAVTSFVALFVYLPLFCYLEAWVQQTPEMARIRHQAESWVIQKVEQIGDDLYKEGTFAKIERAKVEALQSVDVTLVRLDGQVDRAFDRLEGNVDAYLDWYYSLVGEYARIANLLVGELEDYMMEKLEESLQQGDAFQEMEAGLNRALAEYESAQRAYQKAVEYIMQENRLVKTAESFQVVQKISLQDVVNPPIHRDMIGLQTRLMTGGGAGVAAGALTAVIIKKIVAKTMGKGVVKLAAKALGKVVIGKTAGSAGGAGAGAVAGAAIGSAFGPPGMAVGAAVGGLLGGILVGVSVDKLLIELEEAVNRGEFKQEILCAINEARREFKVKLRG